MRHSERVIPPKPPAAKARQSEMVERFTKELTMAGGRPLRIGALYELQSCILSLIKEFNARLVVRSRLGLSEELELDAQLRGRAIDIVDVSSASNVMEALKRADVGITEAEFAIAETGTIAVVTSTEAERLVSSLPPVHLALLESRDIVQTMEDASGLLKGLQGEASRKGLNTVVSFITGPSRTADIEQRLITGVHGPKELCVAVLEGEAS